MFTRTPYFDAPPQKKWHAFNSGNLGGHSFTVINRSPNTYSSIATEMYALSTVQLSTRSDRTFAILPLIPVTSSRKGPKVNQT
jgi:hypothetical protein